MIIRWTRIKFLDKVLLKSKHEQVDKHNAWVYNFVFPYVSSCIYIFSKQNSSPIPIPETELQSYACSETGGGRNQDGGAKPKPFSSLDFQAGREPRQTHNTQSS